MNILLTGVSGFIGTNYIKYIENKIEPNNDEFFILSSKELSQYKFVNHKGYTFTKKDFYNNGIYEIDTVIHIGAFTPKNSTESNNFLKSVSNINNTIHLIQNLPNVPKKFIFLSTIDVYGNSKNIINEETPTIPVSLYGHSKLFCEKILTEWSRENDIILQILRVGHIYGMGEEEYNKIIPTTIKQLKNNRNPQIFGQGNEKRSFLNILDLCKIIEKSIEFENEIGIINICSSMSYTIKEIVELLISISNKNMKIEYLHNNYNSMDSVFDTSKMEKYFGKETITIKEGLKEEYHNFKI